MIETITGGPIQKNNQFINCSGLQPGDKIKKQMGFSPTSMKAIINRSNFSSLLKSGEFRKDKVIQKHNQFINCSGLQPGDKIKKQMGFSPTSMKAIINRSNFSSLLKSGEFRKDKVIQKHNQFINCSGLQPGDK